MAEFERAKFIGLNVGGQVYFTTLSTLQGDIYSRLGRMFTGNFNTRCAKDKDGNFLIDADGPLFRYVIGFMRHGRLDLPEDFKDHNLLESEAVFYQNWRLTEAVVKNRPDFDPKRIYIIVDGKCFSESGSTLMGNKMFAQSLVGRRVHYSLERDKTCNLITVMGGNADSFRYLWQFIQDGSFKVPGEYEPDADALEELKKEASGYNFGVDELTAKIDEELDGIYSQ